MRRRAVPCSVVLALLLAIGCASDGRALRDPPAGATTAPLPSTTLPAGSGTADAAVIGTPSVSRTLLLATTDFADGQPMPKALSCDTPGAKAPPLTWTGVADGTVELALTVTDPDAGGFVHWIVAGIAPAIRAIPSGQLPVGAIQLANDGGKADWTAPCPPPGDKPHRYIFTLYALGQASGLTASTPARDALATLSADAFDTATLAGTYQR